MLYTVKEHQFMALMLQKESFSAENQNMFLKVSAAFATRVHAQMAGTRAALYTYILARTLLIGRSAARISIREFREGSSEDVATAGLGVADSNVRANLGWLIHENWVNAWRTQAESGADKESKMFAIDCNKALSGVDFTQIDSLKERFSAARQRATPRLQTGDHYMNIHSTYGTGINSQNTNRSSGDFAAGPSTEGVSMLPVPKKPRATVQHEQSASAVLTSVKNGYRVARAERVAVAKAKAAHELTKHEAQALLDESTITMIQGKYRLVVTDKEFSVLRKRLKDNPPDDLRKFVDFVVANWYSIAVKQRAAAKKRAGVNPTRDRDMPLAPNFRLFAYWYPYFLSIYQSTNEGANFGESEKDREISRLKRALAAKAIEVEVVKRARVSRTRPTFESHPAPQESEVGVSSDIGSSIDNDLPTWEEASANALRLKHK